MSRNSVPEKEKEQQIHRHAHISHRILNLLIIFTLVSFAFDGKVLYQNLLSTYEVIILAYWFYCFLAFPLPLSLLKYPLFN